MITNSTDALRKNEFISDFDYVIIDEFQDISFGRFSMVDHVNQNQTQKLFCVGDDWQAIYRFAEATFPFCIILMIILVIY